MSTNIKRFFTPLASAKSVVRRDADTAADLEQACKDGGSRNADAQDRSDVIDLVGASAAPQQTQQQQKLRPWSEESAKDDIVVIDDDDEESLMANASGNKVGPLPGKKTGRWRVWVAWTHHFPRGRLRPIAGGSSWPPWRDRHAELLSHTCKPGLARQPCVGNAAWCGMGWHSAPTTGSDSQRIASQL
eukprot:365428-Chlamydomonas_euryale.AAC.28